MPSRCHSNQHLSRSSWPTLGQGTTSQTGQFSLPEPREVRMVVTFASHDRSLIRPRRVRRSRREEPIQRYVGRPVTRRPFVLVAVPSSTCLRIRLRRLYLKKASAELLYLHHGQSKEARQSRTKLGVLLCPDLEPHQRPAADGVVEPLAGQGRRHQRKLTWYYLPNRAQATPKFCLISRLYWPIHGDFHSQGLRRQGGFRRAQASPEQGTIPEHGSRRLRRQR